MGTKWRRTACLVVTAFSLLTTAFFVGSGTGILGGCGEGSTGEGGAGGGGGSGDSGALPSLSADDLNDTAPCPDQTLLTDATFVADAKAATAFTIIVNDDNFPATVCARGSDFALPDTVEDVLVVLGAFDMNNLLSNALGAQAGGGVGVDVCGDDPNVASFPKAGVYRRDFKFTANGRTYRMRMRVTVTAGSPDVTGQSIAASGIGDLQTDIDYVDSGGNPLTIDATVLSNLGDLIPSATFTVKKKADSSTLFTALLEMICAKQI